MRAIGKYAGLEVLEFYTNDAPIWNDSVLICKKFNSKDFLESRLDNIEKKLNILSNTLKED